MSVTTVAYEDRIRKARLAKGARVYTICATPEARPISPLPPLIREFSFCPLLICRNEMSLHDRLRMQHEHLDRYRILSFLLAVWTLTGFTLCYAAKSGHLPPPSPSPKKNHPQVILHMPNPPPTLASEGTIALKPYFSPPL